jgi:hypothetical protein
MALVYGRGGCQFTKKGTGGGIRGYDQASSGLCILVLIFAFGEEDFYPHWR